MRVGIMIEGQEGLTWERWWRLAQAAEDLGYESLCRSDHLTGLGGESKRPSLETWVSLTALATRTRRIRFGPMVSPLTFYHPAILAKMAAAIDTLAGGRFDLGIGAGWNEHEHTMYGVPFPPLKERLDRLECGARVIRALEAPEPVTLDQPYYPLKKAESYPRPPGAGSAWSSAGAARSAPCASWRSSRTSGTSPASTWRAIAPSARCWPSTAGR